MPYSPARLPFKGDLKYHIHMAKTIKQKVTLPASPAEVYDMLMTSKKHSVVTGGKAVISNKVGGKFTAWDGYIEGTNLSLVPGKMIVQAWRATDWAEGAWSVATFLLSPAKGGTTVLEFSQVGVPDKNCKDITKGWTDYYWTPMKAHLTKS
jgi:activator of HSP90 ATPase